MFLGIWTLAIFKVNDSVVEIGEWFKCLVGSVRVGDGKYEVKLVYMVGGKYEVYIYGFLNRL